MVLRLSPNYGVAHLVHVGATITILMVVPMFYVHIKDPDAELLHNATSTYTVECFAFSAKSIGYQGDAMCASYAFGESCWNVFKAMQLQQCGEEPGVIFPAVAATLQGYGRLNDIFVLAIVIMCVVALGFLAGAYAFPKRRSAFLAIIAMLHWMAQILAIALMATSSLAVSAVTYNDNDNKGQTVTIAAGSVSIVLLPFIETFFDATPTAFAPPTKQT